MSVQLVDAILVLVLIESIGLVVVKRFWGFGPSLSPLALTLASGALLLGATRASLVGENWLMLGALAAAGIAHAFDVASRWK